MMKTETLLLTLLALGNVACSSQPTQQEIHNECRLEMAAARTAIQLRDAGKDKQSMLRTLPPLHAHSTRLLQQMYRIVDEVYTYPDLNDIVYGVYHYESCARHIKHISAADDLKIVYPKLANCQKQFARQVSRAAVQCIKQIFPAATPVH